jgi:hypothetical protein
MSSMRPIRFLVTALLVASLAVAGCGRGQPDEATTPADQPPAATTAPTPKAPAPDDSTDSPPGVLADGRHPVIVKSIDASRRTVTFDLIQLYWGDEAAREAARDHQESPPPNDYYIRNVNPRLRTLPVRTDAVITVNMLAGEALKNVPVSFTDLPALMRRNPYASRLFYITVHHDQTVKMAEQYIP